MWSVNSFNGIFGLNALKVHVIDVSNKLLYFVEQTYPEKLEIQKSSLFILS